MNLPTYRRIVWSSALYDLLVTLPFATPWTAALATGQLAGLHRAFGLGGAAPPEFGPLHLVFVSFFGTIVVLWSVLRLRDPQRLYGLADALGRVAFSSWMVFGLVHGETRLVFVFLVPEIAWGLVQLVGWRASWRDAHR